MKKLFRLLIAVFCIFFVLCFMPSHILAVWKVFEREASGLTGTLLPDFGEKDSTSSPSDPDQNPSGAQNAAGTPDSGKSEGNAGSEKNADNSVSDKNKDKTNPDDAKKNASGNSGEIPAQKPVRTGPVSDDSIVYYYYTRISREERLLYDAMLSLAQNKGGDPSAEESRLVSINPSSEEFSVSYTRAFNALINDHPELFWISMSRASYQCRYYILPSFGGQYKVIFSMVYPDDGSSGDPHIRYAGEQEQLRAAADALLAQVDFRQSDADIALRLHDLLLDHAWYNRGAGPDDYAHTAYGALVTDSSGNPGGALCDGYALAYQYLLQRSGLTCAMVSGYAGSSEEDLEKHAWNIVLLDSDWYEVDPTWNDIVLDISPSEEGYAILTEALSDETYMQRIRHYMYNRTTAEMSSFTPGDEYKYSSDNGWVTLLQPSVHIRFTESDSEESRDYVTPLAPTAEGTIYTWEKLYSQRNN